MCYVGGHVVVCCCPKGSEEVPPGMFDGNSRVVSVETCGRWLGSYSKLVGDRNHHAEVDYLAGA